MAILRRYDLQSTFENENGDIFSHRYKRPARNYKFFEVVLDKPMTLDYLSVVHYGTPLLFWAIADLNDLLDPTITLPEGTKIKVPQL